MTNGHGRSPGRPPPAGEESLAVGASLARRGAGHGVPSRDPVPPGVQRPPGRPVPPCASRPPCAGRIVPPPGKPPRAVSGGGEAPARLRGGAGLAHAHIAAAAPQEARRPRSAAAHRGKEGGGAGEAQPAAAGDAAAVPPAALRGGRARGYPSREPSLALAPARAAALAGAGRGRRHRRALRSLAAQPDTETGHATVAGGARRTALHP